MRILHVSVFKMYLRSKVGTVGTICWLLSLLIQTLNIGSPWDPGS